MIGGDAEICPVCSACHAHLQSQSGPDNKKLLLTYPNTA